MWREFCDVVLLVWLIAHIRVNISMRKPKRLADLRWQVCNRRQCEKLWCWNVSSLCQYRMVPPVNPAEFKWWQASMKADNLLIFQLHDLLGGQEWDRLLCQSLA